MWAPWAHALTDTIPGQLREVTAKLDQIIALLKNEQGMAMSEHEGKTIGLGARCRPHGRQFMDAGICLMCVHQAEGVHLTETGKAKLRAMGGFDQTF